MSAPNLEADKIRRLFEAIRSNNLVEVKSLIDDGMNVNYRYNDAGEVAIHFAAGEGRVDVVKALIEAGAEVNAKSENEKTAPTFCAKLLNKTEFSEKVKRDLAKIFAILAAHGASGVPEAIASIRSEELKEDVSEAIKEEAFG